MQESVENIALTLGGGVVAPGIGAAELVLGMIVGLAFAWSAIRAGLFRLQHHDEHHLRDRRR
jgi:hypothetical protein